MRDKPSICCNEGSGEKDFLSDVLLGGGGRWGEIVGYIAVNQKFQKFYFLIVSFPLWTDRFPPLLSLNCKIF